MRKKSKISIGDSSVLVTQEVGARDTEDWEEDGRLSPKNNWLVPSERIDEAALRKNFDPDKLGASVVPSPMWGIKGFLRMGSIVGAFPADLGERYIHFVFEFCDTRTWYILFLLSLWLLIGLAAIVYCLLSSTSPTVASLTSVKQNTTSVWVSSADQGVLIFVPVLSAIFLPIMITLSWARINSLSSICENFVENGYRVGNSPEKFTMGMFTTRIICFLIGLLLTNIHLAILYCDTDVKQIIFSCVVTVWVVPLYLATTFLGYIVTQLIITLSLYFKHLRSDVVYKNDSISRNGYKNDFYEKLVKMGGMPKRLDRLIQEINHLEQVYGATLYYDFIFHILLLTAHIYLSVAVVINSMKTKTISSDPPWWSLGYILLATHHYLRLSQYCQAGEALTRQLDKTLSLVSQFAYVHNDPTLLSLAMARKPSVSVMSVAGYAKLARSTLSVVSLFMIFTMMCAANFKIME